MKRRALLGHLQEHGCVTVRGRRQPFHLGQPADRAEGSHSPAQRNQKISGAFHLPQPVRAGATGRLKHSWAHGRRPVFHRLEACRRPSTLNFQPSTILGFGQEGILAVAAELAGALLDAEMHPDEFFRRDGFGFVTGGFERGKVRVARHDKIRFRRDGAVAEFVVIRILGDDGEPELRFNLSDVAVKPVKQFQQCDDLLASVPRRKVSS